MAVSAFDAANHLAKISNHSVTNLKYHKILYMADMNFVGQTGNRLIAEDFEVWDYGPVLKSLYHKFKVFRVKPVPNIFWGARGNRRRRHFWGAQEAPSGAQEAHQAQAVPLEAQ